MASYQLVVRVRAEHLCSGGCLCAKRADVSDGQTLIFSEASWTSEPIETCFDVSVLRDLVSIAAR